ncbi:Exodeoxyribonuclease III [Anaerohalosphaera lusitana]|uniref:Exodeoxyribonuclease III n=1 Tax=Anaerohalosphaera lusitana TaxID=1936003 RepID=A0A1U9NP63_9BACT|nr:exodeoxyribonuclease III [Anaerohalosphaera lusitana]AQT69703.1 Exodeoxyribonuclease III [Anaerohalosphaera lusitana]
MKAATFNANSIRSRAGIVLDWLEANQPDVLCIQETKVQDDHFPVKAFEDCGYNFVYKGQKAYNGVATFARGQIEDVKIGLDGDESEQARFLKVNLGGVSIVNTYVPQGRAPDSEQFLYKLEWFGQLREWFDKNFSPGEDVLWMGDLNVAMDARDVHDPEKLWGSVCYCQEVQDALKDVMGWGFTDVFRQFNEEDGLYTFWDYRVPNGFKRNIGWRLDYIMASKSMAGRCTGCWVDKEPRALKKPSDHTFLVAEFDI